MKPAKDMAKDIHAQDADCGPGCSCTGSRGAGRVRTFIGILVLAIATVFVTKAIIKRNTSASLTPKATFATSTLSPTDRVERVSAAESVPAVQQAGTNQLAESSATEIATLADLNTMATATDVVFLYLQGTSSEPPIAQMKSVAKTIGAQGRSVGIFTLKTTAPEYKSITAQVPVPCVLAMVKGRNTIPISGKITEAKLLQGFIAASTAVNCGPTGCGPSGCN
jgi:hypothetical protein